MQHAHMTGDSTRTATIVLRGVVLSFACVISYWLLTHLLHHTFSVSRDDDLLGGMWAVAATIFVYRYSHEESVGAALSRITATLLSLVLCLVYLLLFPFNVWGMALLIGLGAVVMTLLGRPDDTITTGITTAVVMVVAAISPDHAWKQPILRLFDTVAGVAVGTIAASIPMPHYQKLTITTHLITAPPFKEKS